MDVLVRRLTRGIDQAFKFSCYVSLPVFLTIVVAGTPQNLATVIKNVRLASDRDGWSDAQAKRAVEEEGLTDTWPCA